MRVYAQGFGCFSPHIPDYPRDIKRERPPVCITKDKAVRPCLLGGLKGGDCINRVLPVAVKEMLGVVKDNIHPLFKITHRIKDHLKVFLKRHPERLFDMQFPALSEYRDGRGARGKKRSYIRIVLCPYSGLPR